MSRESHPRRPSAALVVSIIALIVASGGTSYAAFGLPKNSVGTKQLKNGAVSAKKIQDGAVSKAKLNVTGVTVPRALTANHANTAGSATNAVSATNATNALNATNATNASNAARAASAAATDGYFNSGLVTMASSSTGAGNEQTLVTRGPFSFIGQCQDMGGGNIFADVLVQDNSANGAIEMDFDDSNSSPPTTMNSGDTHGVFDSGKFASPYWSGGANDDFAVSAPGGPALFGTGTMGVNVLGADCAFQLVLFG